jgi:hypothetical protein
MNKTFTCEVCHGTFEMAWTDDEAIAECVDNGFAKMPCNMVCDDCYRNFMRWITGPIVHPL